MALSSYIELSAKEKQQLLDIARRSIRSGLNSGNGLVGNAELDGNLAASFGTFVTLKQQDELRGCMGCLQTADKLAQSVASSAFNAAFKDPRFPNLSANEISQTQLEISVLSVMEPMSVENREDLLNQLKPGIDGLLLEDGRYRSTFLPKVWDDLNRPEAFLEHHLAKAGLAPDYWSKTLSFSRYHTVSFEGNL